MFLCHVQGGLKQSERLPFIFSVTEIPAQTACFDILDNDM